MNFKSDFFSELNDDDKQIVSRVLDFVKLCLEKSVVKFTGFLDLRQQKLVLSVLNKEHFTRYKFYGGYQNAERKVLCIYGEYCEVNDDDFCFDCLEFTYREADKLSHRDFLGCFMNRQIRREMIGDIVVNEGKTYAFIYNTVSSVIESEIKKVGSVGVEIAEVVNPVIEKTECFEEIKGTVPSQRLDAVLSLALRLSREKVSQLIKSVGIEVNYDKKFENSFLISEGDVFSARGYGKFILYSVDGKTKKDRIHITIKKYK